MLRRLIFWQLPTPEEVRSDILNEARLQLIDHQRLMEYHEAIVFMLQRRVKRLEEENDRATI